MYSIFLLESGSNRQATKLLSLVICCHTQFARFVLVFFVTVSGDSSPLS